MQDTEYWIWFSKLRKLNCITKEKMLEKYKSPKTIWNLSMQELFNLNILKENEIQEILNKEYRKNLESTNQYLINNKIHIITILDEIYPQKLKQIYDKPIVLYAKGNLELLKQPATAIVGTRMCSTYGKETAEYISYNLAKENKCIISGLAKGIDTYAHIGALKANGKTIAVIGSGFCEIYPAENIGLAHKIEENNGLLLSEYSVEIKAEKMNFPQRNRIISALSDEIVVVEAREKSGALITADFGLEHGKEIFAVPGNINNFNSKGTNNLIKDGANILTSYKDVLETCYK